MIIDRAEKGWQNTSDMQHEIEIHDTCRMSTILHSPLYV